MDTALKTDLIDFGPHVYGGELFINDSTGIYEYPLHETPVAIDVETDEKDKFVGLALCYDGHRVWYFSVLDGILKQFLADVPLIGHGFKFDAHMMRKWGITVRPEQLLHDTRLLSYVKDTTRNSHHLKDIAKHFLRYNWPTYKEMVGMGKHKQTLDLQPVERVAAYCGMDVFATYKLYKLFTSSMTPSQLKFYNEQEMPLTRILFEMESKGIKVDVTYLKELQGTLDCDFRRLEADLRGQLTQKGVTLPCVKSCPKKAHSHEFNPSSPVQVKNVLNLQGISVRSTDKSVLKQYTQNTFVSTLLEYKKVAKAKSTYVDAFLELPTLPRVHTSFNQVSYDQATDTWKGIRTGRLSSSDPNLQNIPAQGEIGDMVRKAFIPDSGCTLVCADYNQIEYRLLGHFSKDPLILEAYHNDRDIHEETARVLGVDRRVGKTLNFAAIYGAQAGKIAKTADIPEDDAKRFLEAYWKKLPRVTAWINYVKAQARISRGVKTLLGRWIPLPAVVLPGAYKEAEETLSSINRLRIKRGDKPTTLDKLARSIMLHNERVAVNATIQGSAADIMRKAMIDLYKVGIMANLQVHDELLFNCSPCDALGFQANVKAVMEQAVPLSTKVVVSISSGANWKESKS